MKMEFDCIICPRGCPLVVDVNEVGQKPPYVTGFACKRGEVYAKNEIINPMRTISSSIKITGGALPLVSVRLTKPVPKSRIPDVMKKIKEMKIEAPCQIGDVLIYDILGLDSDLIITKAIDKFDS